MLKKYLCWREDLAFQNEKKDQLFLILDINTGKIYQLDHIAAFFCSKIDGNKNQQQIITLCARRFSKHSDWLHRESSQLLKKLLKLGLLADQ